MARLGAFAADIIIARQPLNAPVVVEVPIARLRFETGRLEFDRVSELGDQVL